LNIYELDKKFSNNLFIGDIYMIVRVFDKLIEENKNVNSNIDDLSPICFKILAKKDAILIRIKENKYIDADYIINNNIDNVVDLLINSNNNNLIFTIGTLNPYIGQLYIGKNSLRQLDGKKLVKKLDTLK